MPTIKIFYKSFHNWFDCIFSFSFWMKKLFSPPINYSWASRNSVIMVATSELDKFMTTLGYQKNWRLDHHFLIGNHFVLSSTRKKTLCMCPSMENGLKQTLMSNWYKIWRSHPDHLKWENTLAKWPIWMFGIRHCWRIVPENLVQVST